MLSCPSVAALWTTRHTEYLIVVDPDALNKPLSGVDARLPRCEANSPGVRVPEPPSNFSLKLDARNEQLEEKEIGKLSMQEFQAARLYTGPMYMKYNAVLRGLGEEGLPKVQKKVLFEEMKRLCGDSRYVTTLHCISSAIVKLSRLAKPQTVYRGLAGRVLPSEFWLGQGHGGVDFAVLSTTADHEVAMEYAKAKEKEAASCVMEVKMGMIDRGADLSWLSQYPHEREITFPPYTGLEVLGTRVEGSVLVVELRLNVNLMSPTIEAAVSKRRSAHLQLLDIIHSNLRAANAPQLVHSRRCAAPSRARSPTTSTACRTSVTRPRWRSTCSTRASSRCTTDSCGSTSTKPSRTPSPRRCGWRRSCARARASTRWP